MVWEDVKIPMLVSSILFFIIALYFYILRNWKNKARVGYYPFLHGLDSKKVKGDISIRFDLPHRDKVTVNILDENEQLISSLVTGVHEPGEHEVGYDSSSLEPGWYSYQLVTTRQKSSVRFEKV